MYKFCINYFLLGVILEPHSNVKAPMVRKPIHMIKPRVVTLQTSLHNSLEKRRQVLTASGSSSASLTKNFTDSLLTSDAGHFGKIPCLKVKYYFLLSQWKSKGQTSVCAHEPVFKISYRLCMLKFWITKILVSHKFVD